LKMKFINGKSPTLVGDKGGIGIENAKRRLELIYPDIHQLKIIEEEDVFIVNLEFNTYPNANL